MKSNLTEKLFSYGTLQQENIQILTFGRKLNGAKDVLEGWCLEMVRITDRDVIKNSGKEFHPILNRSKNNLDEVAGMVFDITSEDLRLVDEYEVSDYKRIKVRLQSGLLAWVYVRVDSEI